MATTAEQPKIANPPSKDTPPKPYWQRRRRYNQRKYAPYKKSPEVISPAKPTENKGKDDIVMTKKKIELAALVYQMNPLKIKSVEGLLGELSHLAEIEPPLCPQDKWKTMTEEQKKKYVEDRKTDWDSYKVKKTQFRKKMGELRKAVFGKDQKKPKLRYPNTHEIFRKEMIKRLKDKDPKRAIKDMSPEIKEAWRELGVQEREYYHLVMLKEKEKAIYENKLKELNERIEEVKSALNSK